MLKSTSNEHQHWTFYSMMKIIHRYNNPKEIMNKEGISKSTLYSWLKKLQKEKMIMKSFQGHYELTDKGTDYVDTYEKEDSKNKIRLENMRYKFPIIDGIQVLIKSEKWDKIQPMKSDVIIYHTKEEGLHVRVIAGKDNPCLEITCKPMIGDDIYEIMYEARKRIEYVAELFEKEYSLVLGRVIPVMQPE